MSIYLALNGPNDNGKVPKAPRNARWTAEDYVGIDPASYDGWLGLRTDDLVVVDCDSDEATSMWRTIGSPTFEVKTPRGHHFYYAYVPGAPSAPAVGILPGIDIRAGRGAQVVCPPTPGYEVVRDAEIELFRTHWLAEARDTPSEPELTGNDEWEKIPEGRRNDTILSFAGQFRKQGMSFAILHPLLQRMNRLLCDPPLLESEIEAIARSVCRYDVQPDWTLHIEAEEGDIPSLSDAVAAAGDELCSLALSPARGMQIPPPPEWWWKPYIPKGRLVLIDGSEGIGKGLLCTRLAHQLASDGHTVLWASAEDDPEEDIIRRLYAVGFTDTIKGEILFFNIDPKLPADAANIETLITRTNAQILILDPGRSYLAPNEGDKNFSFNNEASLRPALQIINRLARRTGCTILFIHHWNKDAKADVQYRAGGSGAFAQVVRHRLTLAYDKISDSGAFAVTKSNIGPTGYVHSYRVGAVEEFDTALFVPGEPLHEYPDLGSWIKTMADSQGTLRLDAIDEAERYLDGLPSGSPLLSRPKLCAQFPELPQSAANDLLKRTKENGDWEARRGGAWIKL